MIHFRNSLIEVLMNLNQKVEEYNMLFDVTDDPDNEGSFLITLQVNDGEVQMVENFIETPEILERCLHDYYDSAMLFLQSARPDDIPEGYTVIGGWTHDLPAVIYGVTDEPVYFIDDDGTVAVEEVCDCIDDYEDRHGHFAVGKGRLAIAQWKVWLHDEYGVDY